MKPSNFIFIVFAIENFISSSISDTENCFGRWQTHDKLSNKLTIHWEILSKSNSSAIEFRTNRSDKGFWYGFGLASSSDNSSIGSVYALHWNENDTEIVWALYNVTRLKVTPIEPSNISTVTIRSFSSSVLLTVQNISDLNTFIIKQECFYFVYMRGRFSDGIPLTPEEVRFNQSLCLTCPSYESTSTKVDSTIADVTTDSLMIQSSSTIRDFNLLNERLTTSSIVSASPPNYKKEFKFIWFGRIINRLWSNVYFDLTSPSSNLLKTDLQNLFLHLIRENSSFSFLCREFKLYSLQPGSILYAANIAVISNLSENQTLLIIEELIKGVNSTKNSNLIFDPSAHHIRQINEAYQIDNLFKNLTRTVNANSLQNAEINWEMQLILSCIATVGCLMVFVTTILCLYGYYKCRRREFRLFAERQTLKFNHDINSYTWLGQQPSISSSSPYLIQSTSI